MSVFRIVIPARYQSTRLPGKVLLDIVGKSMLQRVYEKAQASEAESVVIATDDLRIQAAAQDFGAHVVITDPAHRSGTERLAEAVSRLGYEDSDIVVNLQGDEPLVPSVVLKQVADILLLDPAVQMGTLCEKIQDEAHIFDPDVVKVVVDRKGRALYFSRAPIAWERGKFESQSPGMKKVHYRHVGIYSYRVGWVKTYAKWETCTLELLECLEQLRALYHGARIGVVETKMTVPCGIDTKKDLARAIAFLSKGRQTEDV